MYFHHTSLSLISMKSSLCVCGVIYLQREARSLCTAELSRCSLATANGAVYIPPMIKMVGLTWAINIVLFMAWGLTSCSMNVRGMVRGTDIYQLVCNHMDR